MAYRRCLLIRRNIDRKRQPSFTYVLQSDEKKRECPAEKSSTEGISNFIQTRSFGSSPNGWMGFVAPSRNRMFSNGFVSLCSGYNFCRYMSTTNQGSDKIDIMSNVADVVADTTIEAVASQAPGVSEVAIAAADSFLPVKLLQFLIDGVHSYTGLNWWAAIVMMTVLIRIATVPLLINQLKASSKFEQIRPKIQEIREQIQKKDMDPIAAAEGQQRIKNLFHQHGVSPLTPLKGIFIQGPIFISFFLAIRNMAEKMPSFEHGGAFWFVDLTTPDTLYIFPVLTALSYLITVECDMKERLEGNAYAGILKNAARGFSVLTVPFTMGFSKAIFCYWITSNLFSIMYTLVVRVPGVRKSLGLPQKSSVALAPTIAPQSPFSFQAPKQAASAKNGSNLLSDQPSKQDKKISSSPNNRRLKSLEKQVKGRKKNKR
ncbi:unnamed protein product [Lupinus luteus]|uniref:Membrane insertase YidC/Oxa/ALB C-terminal domain-containing protein n=1 Tax=Lupinus luteus TaxID=3873 RepID=A0AAV1XZE6_LUPLU